jgi:hypothetical protein
VGSAGWRKLVQGVTSYAAEVNSSGEITSYVTCASQTTTTTTSSSTTTTSTTSTTTTAAVYEFCCGYDASDCCVAITDYTLNCNL